MSDPRKLPPDEAWDVLTNMAARDEAERVEALSPEELDRELRAMGRNPEAERAKALALVARIKGQAPVVQGLPAEPAGVPDSRGKDATVVPMTAPLRRSRGLVWLVAAALGALAVALFVERQAIIAWIEHRPPRPDDIGPDKQGPLEVAASLRDEAGKACDGGLWGLCQRKLDEAGKLDPAGESSERVKQMRTAIAQHGTPQKPKDEKVPGKGSGP